MFSKYTQAIKVENRGERFSRLLPCSTTGTANRRLSGDCRAPRPSAAMTTVLSHSDIHARNTFDNREVLIPQKKESLVRNGVVVHTFPAASVTALSIHLR